MIRDKNAGINLVPHDERTWLLKDPKSTNDEFRWAAWHVYHEGEWLNRNLKRMVVPAIRFNMALLEKEDTPYEIVSDAKGMVPEEFADLPMPMLEVRMV